MQKMIFRYRLSKSLVRPSADPQKSEFSLRRTQKIFKNCKRNAEKNISPTKIQGLTRVKLGVELGSDQTFTKGNARKI